MSKQPHFKYAAVRIRKAESIPARLTNAIGQVANTVTNTVKTILHQGV